VIEASTVQPGLIRAPDEVIQGRRTSAHCLDLAAEGGWRGVWHCRGAWISIAGRNQKFPARRGERCESGSTLAVEVRDGEQAESCYALRGNEPWTCSAWVVR